LSDAFLISVSAQRIGSFGLEALVTTRANMFGMVYVLYVDRIFKAQSRISRQPEDRKSAGPDNLAAVALASEQRSRV